MPADQHGQGEGQAERQGAVGEQPVKAKGAARQGIGEVGAEGKQRAVGEVDHAQDGEDQRVAQGKERIHAPDGEAVQQLLRQQREVHAPAPVGGGKQS